MQRNSRHAEVGDMIVRKSKESTEKWLGVVYEIKRNKWGHGTAFIHWSSDPPPYYNKEYGIPCVNIHNGYSEYDVIKKLDK
tara:strand:+ start:580 stop:822 length:243 start_codon:yes stop_codon:yes gene_type:complete